MEIAEVNWDGIMGNLEPDTMLKTLTDKVLEKCLTHVPPKALRRPNGGTAIPKDRKTLMRKRANLGKQVEAAQHPQRKYALALRMEAVEKRILYSHDAQRKREERCAVEKIKTNPKFFFSYAKKFATTRAPVGPLMSTEGDLVEDPEKICNILAQQYETVFSTPDQTKAISEPQLFFDINNTTNQPTLRDIEFTEEDIKAAIKELKPNSSAGPDGVPTKLLINCKEGLARPLYLLWRHSMDTGKVPAKTREAYITPIHKGGDRGAASKYRPVALTSHIIKIFEKVVKNKIYSFLETNNLLNPGQHGFRKGRSCLSQLLKQYDNLLRELAEGRNVDTVFLDFAKAFDKVDHGVLLHKLRSLGITDKLGTWLHSFLSGRTQLVAANGKLSRVSKVTSGVPQGSVLGPLLFIVLMGDIDSEVTDSVLTSFADDTNISKSISTVEDVEQLQKDLDKVYTWASNNNMTFNDEKFELLRCGTNQDITRATSIYTSEGETIKATPPHVKCLGIQLSNDGTFQHHIEVTLKKAKKIAGWILRTFHSRETVCMVTLWRALVQPILDYCSQLWSPHKAGDIQAMEAVQRSFTAQIGEVKGRNYWERLQKLGLYSQQRRRERYRIIYIWKTLENLVPDPSASGSEIVPYNSPRAGRMCRRRALPTQATGRVKTLIAASLTNKGPQLFNCLLSNIRALTNCSTEKFKSQLDTFLRTVPDEPPVPGYTALSRAASNSIPDQLHLGRRDARNGNSGGTPWLW